MPIYVFNLAQMSNHELMKAWTEMQVNVPCIALIEDIDNVFHGRENVGPEALADAADVPDAQRRGRAATPRRRRR